MKNLFTIICLTVLASVWANSSYAGILAPWDASINRFQDQPTIGSDQWQNIKSVSWRIDRGEWGQHSHVTVGQTIQWQMIMNKNDYGGHYADHAKGWVDWGGDRLLTGGETVIYKENVIRPTDIDPRVHGYAVPDPYQSLFIYESDEYVILPEHVGELWSRWRTTCSESLLERHGIYKNQQWDYSKDPEKGSDWGWDLDAAIDRQWDILDNGTGETWGNQINPNNLKTRYNSKMSPYEKYFQGDFVDHMITVNAVPEPATITTLAGLLSTFGFFGWRKKRKQAA
ncbi:MAG: hypothetical protein COA78_16935 [Blastopirellula sp.]|nr:MAG: hypothetical protein COA78_16935 [Blastopirellula sp.]